ncbi:hypothetical protein MTR67_031279 [Solanum verrucosum]|uniref:Uncharacterized protein n=1 Tax=Solanum verrucosum TaxID=315347 RepID=A0AAF0ZHE0_SOLVR|nr:hypothetical protein MTR67_031279 [Solanum verrucosum]
MKGILAKIFNANRSGWSHNLDDALWDYHIDFKTPIGMLPYQLVFGKFCHLPIELEHKSFWVWKVEDLILKEWKLGDGLILLASRQLAPRSPKCITFPRARLETLSGNNKGERTRQGHYEVNKRVKKLKKLKESKAATCQSHSASRRVDVELSQSYNMPTHGYDPLIEQTSSSAMHQRDRRFDRQKL